MLIVAWLNVGPSAAQYHLIDRVYVLYVLDNPVFFHFLNKALLLLCGSCCVCLPSNRRGSWGLCNSSIFDLEATGETIGGIIIATWIEHLHSDKPAELLLARLPTGSPCTTLIDHTLDEVGGKLRLTTTLMLLGAVLLRNLNLLLLHLNLNISDSGRGLTVYDQVRRGWRWLPDLVLTYDLNASLSLVWRTQGSHQGRRLLALSMIEHLRLLRGVDASASNGHLRSVEVRIVILGALWRHVRVMMDTPTVMCGVVYRGHTSAIWAVTVMTRISVGAIAIFMASICSMIMSLPMVLIAAAIRSYGCLIIRDLLLSTRMRRLGLVLHSCMVLSWSWATSCRESVWNFLNCELMLRCLRVWNWQTLCLVSCNTRVPDCTHSSHALGRRTRLLKREKASGLWGGGGSIFLHYFYLMSRYDHFLSSCNNTLSTWVSWWQFHNIALSIVYHDRRSLLLLLLHIAALRRDLLRGLPRDKCNIF